MNQEEGEESRGKTTTNYENNEGEGKKAERG
jgi:hypothetical protein